MLKIEVEATKHLVPREGRMAIFKMKVKGNQAVTSIDIGRFQRRVSKIAEIQNRQAVRAWLRATLDYIPTYTGTARGTFKPLGRTLRVAVPLVGKAGRPGRTAKNPRKKKISYGGRTFEMGFSAGEKYAEYKLETKVQNLEVHSSFTFTNSLPYIAYNDINSAPNGFTLPSNPPWYSHERGLQAWKNYIIKEVPKKLPTPKEFVKITKVRVR